MKKKLTSLLLALALVLSLAACGQDSAPKEPPSSGESGTQADADLPEEKPDEDAPEPEAPEEEEPAPAEMSYTFENGTLTCSGNGEIIQKEWIPVVSAALFETEERYCIEAVEKVVIEPGVTVIGDRAFATCYNISSVTIPDTVVKIGSNAFDLYFSDSVQNEALTSLVIPESVTEIGSVAFAGCKNLTSVSWPKNVTVIPEGVFYGSGLTSFEIPEWVTAIGGSAFRGCPITELTIPDSVTAIGARAFSSTKLKELTIPATVKEWDIFLLGGINRVEDLTLLCEATMDNVSDLIGPVLEFYEYGLFVDLGLEDSHITIHVPSGSVLEGYIKREIEKSSYLSEYITLETI